MEGADLSLTQKFLEKRQKLKDGQADKQKKDVDRKASKNRKIRYIVHEKIVNFMTPLDNIYLQDGKDNIINNLFGKVNTVSSVPEGKSKEDGKRVKSNGKNGKQSHKHEVDNVRLI